MAGSYDFCRVVTAGVLTFLVRKMILQGPKHCTALKVTNLVLMRLISHIDQKWKLSCLWQNFNMPVSHIHFLFVEAGQCATKKNETVVVDLPN